MAKYLQQLLTTVLILKKQYDFAVHNNHDLAWSRLLYLKRAIQCLADEFEENTDIITITEPILKHKILADYQ
ncbi:10034_t:CDS:2 [Ambispora gerdemannii]|uniref:10034_t:CDS:1 n=1 Tax=Ambispora gerdemannii TaxID=144530 RepID=A0A9N9G3B1_9GLOM|nr:10034_t:CDS:2 [Ambispora gerdemannii]